MSHTPTLVLIDGMSFVFRAYHAVRSGLTRSDGLPVNALFGMAQMLVKVVNDLRPEECAVALDPAGKNWRHALFADYKANRKAPDPELLAQLPLVEPLVQAFGLPVLRVPGFEADDVLATVVAKRRAAGGPGRILIVTSDKDLLQLVGEEGGVSVQLVDTLKDMLSGPAESVSKFGVPPAQVAEVQGLMGDSSDNIPGVPGVGPKTAAELVQQFGTLEELFARLGEVPRETLRAKLAQFKEQALLSRELARLKNDVPLESIAWPFAVHLAEAGRYLRETLEFKTLSARLEKLPAGTFGTQGGPRPTAGMVRTAAMPVGAPATAVAGDAVTAAWGPYASVTTLAEWQAWLAKARARGAVALDTETTSLDPFAAELVGVSLAVGPGEACYVPIARAQGGDLFNEAAPAVGLPLAKVLADLRALCADPTVRKLGHNLKYDWQVLACAWGVMPGETGAGLQGLFVNYDDSLLQSACLDGGRWAHNLDELVQRHLDHAMLKFKDVVGKGQTFADVPLATATAYAAEDADAAWRLGSLFTAQLAAAEVDAAGQGPRWVYQQLERPLLPVVVALEARGMRVDGAALHALSATLAAQMATLEQEIWALAGHEFNVQSTQQLAVVLFDELAVGNDKMRKSRSTAVDVLEELAEGEGPGARVARLMGEYRQVQKLRSTYAEALPKQVQPKTGRVHTHFMQMGAATGRFSSSEPNLQNIPIRTAAGRGIRQAFVPAPGLVLVSADYSQIELRLLAHFSGSQALRQAFVEGLDIHAYTASLVHNVPLAAVTKEQRRAAKFVNFGLIYGMGARSLAGQIGCSVTEAQAWIAAYFARYDGVRDYMEANKKQAREQGFVRTLMGRRVWLPEIASTQGGRRAGAERAAINAPLQGSNADIIKLALLALEPALAQTLPGQAQVLLNVHDEVVLEATPDAVPTLRTLLPQVMTGVVTLSVPLAVEVGTGPNWDAAH